MTNRITRVVVTLPEPFLLAGLGEPVHAGRYEVTTEENLSTILCVDRRDTYRPRSMCRGSSATLLKSPTKTIGSVGLVALWTASAACAL